MELTHEHFNVFPSATRIIVPTCQTAAFPSSLVSLGYPKAREYLTLNLHSFLSTAHILWLLTFLLANTISPVMLGKKLHGGYNLWHPPRCLFSQLLGPGTPSCLPPRSWHKHHLQPNFGHQYTDVNPVLTFSPHLEQKVFTFSTPHTKK